MNSLIPADAYEILGYDKQSCPSSIKTYIDRIAENQANLDSMIQEFKLNLAIIDKKIKTISNQYKELGLTVTDLGLSLLNASVDSDGEVNRGMAITGGIGTFLGLAAIIGGEIKRKKDQAKLEAKKYQIIQAIKDEKRKIAETKLPHLWDVHKTTEGLLNKYEEYFWQQCCEQVDWRNKEVCQKSLDMYHKRVELFRNMVFFRNSAEKEMIKTYEKWSVWDDYTPDMSAFSEKNINNNIRTYWYIDNLLMEYATESNGKLPVVLLDVFTDSRIMKYYIAKPSSSTLDPNGKFSVDASRLRCLFPESLNHGSCYEEKTNSFKKIDKKIWFDFLRQNDVIIEIASACDEMKRLNRAKGNLWRFPRIFDTILSQY